MSTPDATLDEIQQARTDIRNHTRGITRDVAKCRDAGCTWEQIGDALGITKQAAQQRYGHKNHWTAADTAAGQTPSMFSHNGK